MSERCAIHPERLAEITCTRCGSFACYECVGASPDRVCARCRMRTGGGQSRVGQLRLLGGLTLANGILVTLFGTMYVLIAVVFAFIPPSGNPDDPPPELTGAIMGCFGLVHIVPGILQIAAGPQLLRMRGRGLAFVALCSGLVTVFGCYCMPTSIAVMVFGMIVLNDPAVKARLDEGASA